MMFIAGIVVGILLASWFYESVKTSFMSIYVSPIRNLTDSEIIQGFKVVSHRYDEYIQEAQIRSRLN
jgi:hypothetical protein